MRTITDICRDLDAAKDLVTKYSAERAAAFAAEREGVVKAYDDGASYQQIMEAFGVTYQRVANVLNKAGRNERQRSAVRAQQFDAALQRIAAEKVRA
jgi:DNA invertase Pin-like site-specific DNA recombinase